ncbi:MAG TPA: CNP1-like family protein [Azoarcus taiwanensis]|nr:CNP1-like family protein [Azoarcus taiwanensis]
MASIDSHSFLNPRRALGLAGFLFFLGAASGVQAGLFSDPDPNWAEGVVSYPEPPAESSLRQFFVSAASSNRFYLDERTLTVGDDGVIRYVLIVRTPGGAENVSFEGIRCATGERRIYALGRADGEWAPARRSEWEPIIDNAYNRPRAALAFDYFCDGPAPPRSAAEALRLLRQDRRRVTP